MADIILTLESTKALKIALGLRRTELLLQMLVDGSLPKNEQTEATFGGRQEQLLYLASMFERAVKDQSPELPAHVRPAVRNTKQVWCRTEGCGKSLTLEESRSSHFCAECQKKPAAT